MLKTHHFIIVLLHFAIICTLEVIHLLYLYHINTICGGCYCESLPNSMICDITLVD